MIHKVLPVIVAELNSFLKRSVSASEDLVILSSLVNQSGSLAFTGADKVICTVTAIEQERVNISSSMTSMAWQNPPIYLNLNLLFSAYFPGDYVAALEFVSLVISFFQGKPFFTQANTSGLPEGVDKLIIEINHLDQHAQNELWIATGAKMMPSINMKLRMIAISGDHTISETPEIKGLGSTTQPPRN
jgi:hypothetical protein